MRYGETLNETTLENMLREMARDTLRHMRDHLRDARARLTSGRVYHSDLDHYFASPTDYYALATLYEVAHGAELYRLAGILESHCDRFRRQLGELWERAMDVCYPHRTKRA